MYIDEIKIVLNKAFTEILKDNFGNNIYTQKNIISKYITAECNNLCGHCYSMNDEPFGAWFNYLKIINSDTCILTISHQDENLLKQIFKKRQNYNW